MDRDRAKDVVLKDLAAIIVRLRCAIRTRNSYVKSVSERLDIYVAEV